MGSHVLAFRRLMTEPAARNLDVGALVERRVSPFQVAVVAWLSALMMLEGFDMQALAFAAPALIRTWHVSRASFGPVLSASLVGYLLGALTLAGAADAFGRKRLILAGTVIFGCFTLACAFAPNLGTLL